jgi:hypothetical protein
MQQDRNDKVLYDDHILEAFVSAANTFEFSMNISLMVKGIIVCGDIISGEEYFDRCATKITSVGGVIAIELGNVLKKISTTYKKDYQEEPNAPEKPYINFIHLKNVQYYVPGNPPLPLTRNENELWRGKLSSVDGFSFGRFLI